MGFCNLSTVEMEGAWYLPLYTSSFQHLPPCLAFFLRNSDSEENTGKLHALWHRNVDESKQLGLCLCSPEDDPKFRVIWVEERKETLTQIYEPGVLRWQPQYHLSQDTQTPFNGFYLSNLCGVLKIQICTEQGKWLVAHSLYSYSYNVSLSTYGISEDLNQHRNKLRDQ